MAKKSSGGPAAPIPLPKMTTLALTGKQSVRTSFKLSPGCIRAINIVATQLGIKHRSLFDYLVEDIDALESLAKTIVKKAPPRNKGSQKSFILSRETLRALDNLCQKLTVSRDTLIELSVRRLLPIIEKEIEYHRNRQELYDLVDSHYQQSRKVLDTIKKSVGAEDPAYKVYQTTVAACRQAKKQFGAIISRGKVVDGFDPDALRG